MVSVSDMPTSGDPRTTIRWDPDDHAWLVAQARVQSRAQGRDVGVGTVVQAIVRAERQRAIEREIAGAAGLGTSTLGNVGGASAGVGRVRGAGAAPSPSGAVPARSRSGVRLDVVVARQISPGPGPIPPVALGAARQLIREGGVVVSGVGQHELRDDLVVGPGEVVVL